MATATSAATALTPSSLSSLLARHCRVSGTIPIFLPINKPISQHALIASASRKLRAKSSDDGQTFFFQDPAGAEENPTESPEVELNQEVEQEIEEEDAFIPSVTPPEGFTRIPYYDEGPEETEEEIGKAYEELYGPVYSSESFLGNDVFVMDSKKKSAAGSKPRDGLEERVVQVRRVNKVVKGGRQLNFRAIVIVGDKKCNVGVGVGKAKEVVTAVQKAVVNARRNLVTLPLTKYSTFPHRAQGKYGAASVMLRPASPGTGVIAGGAVRVVLEMAGVQNALGKQLGSKNPLNNARATVAAAMQMRQFGEVSRARGIPMEELWK